MGIDDTRKPHTPDEVEPGRAADPPGLGTTPADDATGDRADTDYFVTDAAGRSADERKVRWEHPPGRPGDLAYVGSDNPVLFGDHEPTAEEREALERDGWIVWVWDDNSARIQAFPDAEALALRAELSCEARTQLPDGRERIERPLFRVGYGDAPGRSPSGQPRQIYSPAQPSEDYRAFISDNGIPIPEDATDERGEPRRPPDWVSVARIVTDPEHPHPFVTGHSIPGGVGPDGAYRFPGGSLEVVIAEGCFEYEEMRWDEYLRRYRVN